MPSRERNEWKPDASGVFVKQIGYLRSDAGKLSQPKFRLGTDSKEAKRRADLIRQLWDHLEAATTQRPFAWPAWELEAAKEIAKGSTQIAVPRDSDERFTQYARRMTSLGRKLPMLSFKPADETEFDLKVVEAQAMVEMAQLSRRTVRQMEDDLLAAPLKTLGAHVPDSGPKFHEALRSHSQWIEKEYLVASTGQATQWGRVRMKRVQSLLDHHSDFAISRLDLSKIEELYLYWRQRPKRKNSEKRLARKSAANQITALKDFFLWLHKSPNYEWRRPSDLDLVETRVKTFADDRRRQVTPAVIYSLDELVLLNKYATPLERIFLLLALNCGFNRAEIASLLIGEVFIRQPHDKLHQEMLGFQMTPEDSFIKRVRRKSGVYGEHILFPQTKNGIEWALANRPRVAGVGPDERLLLNDNGQPYDRPSKSGNANQQITNRYGDLLKRIQDDKNIIRKLSFGKLRKTAGDLIRRFSDGETAGVFLCHGQPVETDSLADVYSSRPFGKVFAAIRKVQEYLKPVFEAAGDEPFKPGPQAYTKRSTVDTIIDLHQNGMAPAEIASTVEKSVATVQRHITKAIGPRKTGRPRKAR